jgi:hypothetical protein
MADTKITGPITVELIGLESLVTRLEAATVTAGPGREGKILFAANAFALAMAPLASVRTFSRRNFFTGGFRKPHRG